MSLSANRIHFAGTCACAADASVSTDETARSPWFEAALKKRLLTMTLSIPPVSRLGSD
jgi:hypothetical protein